MATENHTGIKERMEHAKSAAHVEQLLAEAATYKTLSPKTARRLARLAASVKKSGFAPEKPSKADKAPEAEAVLTEAKPNKYKKGKKNG